MNAKQIGLNSTAALLLAVIASSSWTFTTQAQSAPYFPERFDWLHKKPAEVDMDAARLDEAVKFAIASENPATKVMSLYLATTYGQREPFDAPIGPIKDRGGASGLILRHGYIVAE